MVVAQLAGAMAGLVDFQDEEQVKSFLENMKVECNYHCYHEKDPEGERPSLGLVTRGSLGLGVRGGGERKGLNGYCELPLPLLASGRGL